MKCEKCGFNIEGSNESCKNCGAPIENKKVVYPKKGKHIDIEDIVEENQDSQLQRAIEVISAL